MAKNSANWLELYALEFFGKSYVSKKLANVTETSRWNLALFAFTLWLHKTVPQYAGKGKYGSAGHLE